MTEWGARVYLGARDDSSRRCIWYVPAYAGENDTEPNPAGALTYGVGAHHSGLATFVGNSSRFVIAAKKLRGLNSLPNIIDQESGYTSDEYAEFLVPIDGGGGPNRDLEPIISVWDLSTPVTPNHYWYYSEHGVPLYSMPSPWGDDESVLSGCANAGGDGFYIANGLRGVVREYRFLRAGPPAAPAMEVIYPEEFIYDADLVYSAPLYFVQSWSKENGEDESWPSPVGPPSPAVLPYQHEVDKNGVASIARLTLAPPPTGYTHSRIYGMCDSLTVYGSRNPTGGYLTDVFSVNPPHDLPQWYLLAEVESDITTWDYVSLAFPHPNGAAPQWQLAFIGEWHIALPPGGKLFRYAVI